MDPRLGAFCSFPHMPIRCTARRPRPIPTLSALERSSNLCVHGGCSPLQQRAFWVLQARAIPSSTWWLTLAWAACSC